MSEAVGAEKSLARPTMGLPSYIARVRRRKLLMLILLIIILLGTALSFARYYANREEPLPTIDTIEKGKIIPPNFTLTMNGGRSKDLVLSKPQAIAVHPVNGNIYVTSFIGNELKGRVSVFRPDGTFLFAFNQVGKDAKGTPLTLRSPLYIAINKKGNVYISDKLSDTVFVFSENGKFISKFIPNDDPNFSWAPVGVAFDADDNLYVTDIQKEHRVLVFDTQRKLKLQFGETGMAMKKGEYPGKFYFPNCVFIDRDKNIFVSDSNNRRVQVFSPAGKLLYIIETGGLPRGIAIDDKDRLYAVDALGHNISVYKKTSKDGQTMAVFGERGVQFGQFLYPNGLALDKSGRRIYVTDRENNRIQVWTWPVIAAAVTKPVKQALPYALALSALAALLAWRQMRRRRYFASASFMNEIIADHQLFKLKQVTKRVYVAPSIYESLKNYSEGDITAQDVLRPITVDDAMVQNAKTTHKLDDEAAVLFAEAQKGWIKPRILSNDATGHLTALKLNMESMDYQLFTDYHAEAAS